MASPKVPNAKIPNTKVRIEDVITKDGKFDSDKFWKLSEAQIADLVGDAIHDIRNYIMKPNGEAASSVRLLEALDKENPDLGLGRYVTLFRSIESGNGSALTKSYFDDLKQYDPDTFNIYLKHPGWEAYDRPDFDFEVYRAENMPKDAEPNPGVFTGNPVDTASPAETPSGVLTNPPPELPKKETVIREPIDDAEMNELITKGPERTYIDRVGNTTLKPGDKPAFLTKEGGSLPKKGVVVGPDTPIIPEGEKSAAVSTSPEAIHEAMADAVASKDGTVTVPPESIAKAEAAAKETEAKTPATKEAPKTETETEAATDKTNAKTSEITETPQGLFSRLGGHIGRNLGKYLLGGGLGTVGWVIINDLASKDSKLRSSFTGSDVTVETNTPSASQPRIKSLDQREGAYMPERLLRFRQDTQDPFISNTNVNAGYEPVNEDTPVQQVVNTSTPENNATADYVRAAYNSYIPSDAGRAYQKAIYGDPLELERNRLQQKWRDFVMRSGQSPAELVQRGLMPYDALQYV